MPEKNVTKFANSELTCANWRFFPSWTENFKKESGDGSFGGGWNRLICRTEDNEDLAGRLSEPTVWLAVCFGKEKGQRGESRIPPFVRRLLRETALCRHSPQIAPTPVFISCWHQRATDSQRTPLSATQADTSPTVRPPISTCTRMPPVGSRGDNRNEPDQASRKPRSIRIITYGWRPSGHFSLMSPYFQCLPEDSSI